MGEPAIRPVLVVGPRPPAVGGVASLVAQLESVGASDGIRFLDAEPPPGTSSVLARARHAERLAAEILAWSRQNRGGVVVSFGHAGRSFWERCLWTVAARITGARMRIVMVDGNLPSFLAGLPWWKRSAGRAAMRRTDRLVALSPRWEAILRDSFPGLSISRAVVGVDERFFSPPETPRIAAAAPTLLYVGWWLPAKGVPDLLEACGRLKQHGVAFRLRLVGPPKGHEDEVRANVRRRGLEEAVDLVGPITDRAAMRDEYRRADVFVLPSHFEGMPVSLLEAMACGLPSIATDVGGIPDVLRDGEDGLLVPRRDPLRLADALGKTLQDRQLRVRLGKNARERVLQEHNLERSTQSLRDLLEA